MLRAGPTKWQQLGDFRTASSRADPVRRRTKCKRVFFLLDSSGMVGVEKDLGDYGLWVQGDDSVHLLVFWVGVAATQLVISPPVSLVLCPDAPLHTLMHNLCPVFPPDDLVPRKRTNCRLVKYCEKMDGYLFTN